MRNGCIVAAALAVACALTAGPAEAKSPQFWVSPEGDDTASGDRAQPFRTLERARDAVRALGGDADGEITVFLHGGTYRLEQPFVLDARDSGRNGHDVVYAAASGEQPVLSGAVRVEGWSLYDPALGIYRASVGQRHSRQLYVDGVRAVRAQSEPYPADYERTDQGYRFVGSGDAPATWTNPTEVEAVTITQWKMMSCPVGAVAGNDVQLVQPCWKNANVFQAKPGEEPLWDFQLLSRFENAYQFLDQPGEWYLDSVGGWLYYIPRPGEDLATADVELPVLEKLVDGQGILGDPVSHVRFTGLTFSYATWLQPSTDEGYVSDQSGFHLVGEGHPINIFGHDQNDVRTPGNVSFIYADHVTFLRNRFEHLGAVGLDFDTGSRFTDVTGNTFQDISSAGIQLGGILLRDHHPIDERQVTRDNLISNNLVQNIGVDYVDAAGIYVGFTTRSLVRNNDIRDVPWAGIAMGWGWGLLDPGGFAGVPGAVTGEWGFYVTPTTNRGNRVLNNRIERFLMKLWDGGAIYTQGRQGRSFADALRIAGNVANDKRPAAGGNIFYTDGGSRYVILSGNASFDNPQGLSDFGPCDVPSHLPLCFLKVPYGSDAGGCRPYGDLRYESNYTQFPNFYFYAPCPYPPYPVNVTGEDNHIIFSPAEVPERVIRAAGRQGRYRDSGS